MKFGVNILTENFDESEVKSEFTFDLGLISNPKFQHLKNFNLPNYSISFLFHNVNDQESLKNNLESTITNLKELLLELGEDFKEAINQIEFKTE